MEQKRPESERQSGLPGELLTLGSGGADFGGGFVAVGNSASEATAEQTAAIEQELEGITPEALLVILAIVLGAIR